MATRQDRSTQPDRGESTSTTSKLGRRGAGKLLLIVIPILALISAMIGSSVDVAPAQAQCMQPELYKAFWLRPQPGDTSSTIFLMTSSDVTSIDFEYRYPLWITARYSVTSNGVLTPSKWGKNARASVEDIDGVKYWYIYDSGFNPGDVLALTLYGACAQGHEIFDVRDYPPCSGNKAIPAKVYSVEYVQDSSTVPPTLTFTVETSNNAEGLEFTFDDSQVKSSFQVFRDGSAYSWPLPAEVSISVSGARTTWVVAKVPLGGLTPGVHAVRVSAFIGCTFSTREIPVTITALTPAVQVPTITSATPNPASGTEATKFQYTVVTSSDVTKLRFAFSGNSTVYEVSSAVGSTTATLNFAYWGGSTTAAVSNSGSTRTWVISNDLVGLGTRTVTVTATNSAGKTATKTFTVVVSAPVCAVPTISSATPSPATGTEATKYQYTVVTSSDVTKLSFTFNGVSGAYTASSAVGSTSVSLSPAKWDGSVTATVSNSGSTRTWTISNDWLGTGNRTITVTATNGCGKTASKAFTVVVSAPACAVPTISSATPSPATGTEATQYKYTVVTSSDVTKLSFTFNGVSGAYTASSAVGSTSVSLSPAKWDGSVTATVSNSGSTRTWTISNDWLGTGNRTINVTASNGCGKTAAKAFTVVVSKTAAPVAPTCATPTLSSAIPSPKSGTESTNYKYTVVTSSDVTTLKFTFNGVSGTYTATSSAGSTSVNLSPAKWYGSVTVTVSNSGSTRTWTISNDYLSAGTRTISVTASNACGKAASASFSVLVIKSNKA